MATYEQGDDGYDEIYQVWVASGRPHTFESLSEGWLRRVLFPNGEADPVFADIVYDDSYPRPLAQRKSFAGGPVSYPTGGTT